MNGVENTLNRKSGDMVLRSFHGSPEEEDEEGPPDHPQPASPALGSGGFLDQNKGGHPPRPEAWCGSSTVAWGLCLFLALLLPS